MDKTTEYLRLLQEKNRLKKMMATKSKDEQAKEELEKGFSTHFQGAHAIKESKMPVQTKATAIVKPLNIMGRFAKSANMMWGSDRKNEVVSPIRSARIEDQDEPIDASCSSDRKDREDGNYHSEYESDFDDFSDNDAADLKTFATNGKEKRGLQMPSLIEEEDDFFAPRDTVAPNTRVPSSLHESVALDSTLQTRVKDLSAQQKLKLMKLLEQDLHQEAVVEPNIVTGKPVASDEHSPPTDKSSPIDSYLSDSRIGGKAGNVDHHNGARSPERSQNLIQEDVSISFRVRIITAWSPKAKFVSLGAIRLRAPGGESVDLLPLLTAKACAGLTPLPAGSECMRALPQLLGSTGSSSSSAVTRRPASAYRGPTASSVWKGPLSTDSPLELQFSGDLPASSLNGRGIENLELLLWNCSAPPLNSSSVRDVDVFVGGRCVWSGQLEESAGEENVSTSASHRPGELLPTLVIFPWQTGKASALKYDVSASIIPSVQRNDGDAKKLATNIFAESPQTPPRDVKVSSSKPNWLAQQLHGSVPSTDLSNSEYFLAAGPQRKAGRSQRHREDANVPPDTTEPLAFGSPKKRVSAAGKRVSNALAKSVEAEEPLSSEPTELTGCERDDAEDATASVTNSAAAKRRAARRDRNHLLKDLQPSGGAADGAGTFEANNGGFSPQRNTTSAKEQREAELKKSIDSMAFNDKFNLGRLSASKLPFVRPAEDDSDNLLEMSGALDESLGAVPFAYDSLDRPTTPVVTRAQPVQQQTLAKQEQHLSPQRWMGRGGSNSALGLATGNDTVTRATRDSDRTAKIDQVQEKISSTIAGLAKIMSTIPAGGISLGKADASKSGSPTDIDVPGELTPPRAAAASHIVGAGVSVAVVDKLSPRDEKKKEKERAEIKPWHKKEFASSSQKTIEPATTISSLHTLVIEIDSNWGDANYVGMNGVELYDRAGSLIQLNVTTGRSGGVRSITAFPRDLADLPEHRDDPRKVQNLFNGVNFTKNDLHSWLTPHIQVLKRTESASNSAVAALPYIAKVVVELDAGVVPVMCRLFNYNRSRTRNQRGVRHFKLIVDDVTQFEGELKKASGQLHSEEMESQVVFLDAALSDSDKATLRSHLAKRERFEGEIEEEELGEASGDLDQLEQSWAELSVARPRTSAGVVPPPLQSAPLSDDNAMKTAGISLQETKADQQSDPVGPVTHVAPAFSSYAPAPSFEPLDAHMNYPKASDATAVPTESHQREAPATYHSPSSSNKGQNPSRMMVSAQCKVLRLDLQSTWGDASYVGLCGLEVLVGPDFAPARIGVHQLRAQPKDLTEIGCYDDPRVLSNLLNGINNTADDTVMWIIPFTNGSEHFIEIDLLKVCDVVGIRVWNYNKSTEQVLRGCRQLAIRADGRPLCQCLLRMGPGSDGVSFGQTILFCEVEDILQGSQSQYAPLSRLRLGQQKETRLTSYMSPAIRQDFEPPLNPTGLLWKFTFFDNWNDGYYIGLDGVEFFDSTGRLIDTAALGAQVQAVPYSAQDVVPLQPGSSAQEDPRTPSQLFQRARGGRGEHPEACWLAPLSRCMTPIEKTACVRRALASTKTITAVGDGAPTFPLNNVLYVLFQHPVTVSAIRLYNYSKSPTRGVRDFQVEVDGLYLYMGSLLRADREKTTPQILSKAAAGGAAPSSSGISRGQSVLFTNDPKIMQTHKDTVSYCGVGEQDVLCINEKQVMVRSKNMYDQEPPNTSLEGVRADLDKRPMTAAVRSGGAGARN